LVSDVHKKKAKNNNKGKRNKEKRKEKGKKNQSIKIEKSKRQIEKERRQVLWTKQCLNHVRSCCKKEGEQ